MTCSKCVIRVVVVSVVCAVCPPAASRAQQPAAMTASIDGTPAAGQCSLVVTLSQAAPVGAVIQLAINKNPLPIQNADRLQRVTLTLKGPLEEGDEVRARVAAPPEPYGEWGPSIVVAGSANAPQCQAGGTIDDDERQSFEPSAYLGYAFDNFAPASVGGYGNTQGGGTSRKRFVGGVDFDFRAVGTPASRQQLWFFGETLHGVRSADVNCAAPDKPPVCGTLLQNPEKQTLFILEHASSMEAFIGTRWDVLTLQSGTPFPTKLYVTAQIGVMMLDGQAAGSRTAAQVVDVHHAYSSHHVGVGFLATKDPYAGSHIEIGWGRTDLFNTDPDGRARWNRLKVNGMLSFPIGVPFTSMTLKSGPRAFVQLVSDFDPSHKTSDSVQTFVGLDFDVRDVFKW